MHALSVIQHVCASMRVQALAEELKQRPGDLVQRYRELGCVDIAVSATSAEGVRRAALQQPRCAQQHSRAGAAPR